jgi:hypothetical protein
LQVLRNLPSSVRIGTSLACALAALSAPALAQSAPAQAPSPSPAPVTAVAPASEPQRHINGGTLSSFSHAPIIDIVPVFTSLAGFSSASQTKGFDPVDVGGTIQIPITRSLSFSFDRNVNGLYNQAPERIISNAGAFYPGRNRDVVLVERLDYQLKQFVIEGGLSFRHRVEGSGVSTGAYPFTISSTEWHYGYLGVTYTTKPIRALGGSRFVFGITGEEQPVDHHVAVLDPTTHLVKYVDMRPNQSRYFESTQQVGILIPVDPRHGLSVSAKDIWGAGAFYENAPFPYRYTGTVVLTATKKVNDYLSLSVRTSNVHAVEQGYPFPVPNATHNRTIDVLADFHIDTGRLGLLHR